MPKNTTTMSSTINNTTTMPKKEQEEKTMKNTTSKNTTSPKSAPKTTTSEVMSAKDFKQASYDAYLAYVSFIEGKKSIAETVEALSPLMAAYGFTLSIDNLANLLTVKMTAFGKDKGEQAKKVKSISTFRAFVKGGWKDVAAAPVHSNAGKNPADLKTASKTKKPTKAELEAKAEADAKRIAELEAMLADSKSEEKAA